jgi:hypothetical protein
MFKKDLLFVLLLSAGRFIFLAELWYAGQISDENCRTSWAAVS